MKLEFENEKEKECFKHIIFDWLINNGDDDILGCEPACRNLSSPSCEWCIANELNQQLEKNKLNLFIFGGEEWLMEHKIKKEKKKCN